MKKTLALLAIMLLLTIGYAQRSENIVSKDTVLIDIKKITIVEKVSEKTSKRTIYLRYNNRNYNTDTQSLHHFKTSTTAKAYIIYNNYGNSERKVSKLFVKYNFHLLGSIKPSKTRVKR